jgi:hypothetical protein
MTVTPGATITVTINNGGAGGTSFKSDSFSAGVLGSDGGSVVFGSLTVPGGKGGGLNTGNTMSSQPGGMCVGGIGGSVTIDSVAHSGQAGGNSSLAACFSGNGGGPGGGRGGVWMISDPTAGVSGGGGGGAIRNTATPNGAAGGKGFIRFCYVTNTVTGNT